MKDVTRKPPTLRSARAAATITMPADCIPLVRERRTEKGDAIEAARFAATMAVKRTWELIPHCHPLPIQDVKVSFDIGADRVTTEVLVRTIANTGVEMEALTGASVAALTFYDMLKPHAGTRLAIGEVHLIEKLGGKSHYHRRIEPPVDGALLVRADAVPADLGAALAERLDAMGIRCGSPVAVAGDGDALAARIRDRVQHGAALVAVVGGVGLGHGDDTVERVRPLLDRELPGIIEAARNHGQQRTPYAMLLRGVAGLSGRSVVLTLPGDADAAAGCLDALAPGLVHLLDELRASADPRREP